MGPQTVIIVLVIMAIFAGVVLVNLLLYWFSGSGAEALLLEKTSPAATVRGECYVRESHMEEPCAAQVLDGELMLYTATGKAITIPLNELRLTRIKSNNIAGRYPWFRKTVFFIESPRTSGLRLGVRNSEAVAWKRVLSPENEGAP